MKKKLVIKLEPFTKWEEKKNLWNLKIKLCVFTLSLMFVGTAKWGCQTKERNLFINRKVKNQSQLRKFLLKVQKQ